MNEARRLLEEFDAQPLSMKTFALFEEALDRIEGEGDQEYFDEGSAGEALRLKKSYTRSLLQKLATMPRSDKELSMAVIRVVQFRVYAEAVAAAEHETALLVAYNRLVEAWQEVAPIVVPLSGPLSKQHLRLLLTR